MASAKNIAQGVIGVNFNGSAVIIVAEVVSKRPQVALESLDTSFTPGKRSPYA
jgi:hypothetical protein